MILSDNYREKKRREGGGGKKKEDTSIQTHRERERAQNLSEFLLLGVFRLTLHDFSEREGEER